jgi:hypothetical protein
MKDEHAGQSNRSDTVVRRPVLGETKFWKRLWNVLILGKNNKVRIHPLPLFLLFGLAGILIDLDHLIIEQIQRVRPLHLEYFIGVWVIGICYYAYYYRRIHKPGIIWIWANKLKR